MKRATLNMIIDGVAFVGFVLLTTTGLLLRYQLPPGSGRLLGAGTGPGAMQREISLVWGLTRHQWGDVHYWLALGILTMLALHIVLHWRWIVSLVRGKRRESSGLRLAAGALSLVGVLLLGAPLLVSSKAQVARGQLADQPFAACGPSHPGGLPHIQGRMTLQEVEDLSGVPAITILRRLDMPLDIPMDQQLGRLGRRYGITMHDVRQALAERGPP